jgi:prepilin-type processing-associated H-X9-DG protein
MFGKGTYAGYTGPFHTDDYVSPGAIRLFGQKMKRVSDGASSTLVASEVRTRAHDLDQRGTWALPWSGATLLAMDAHPIWYQIGDGERSFYEEFIFAKSNAGNTQTPNTKNPDVLYHCPEPTAEQFERMPCTDTTGYRSAAPRSRHAEGVNSVFLDGSVHFLANSIDEETMAHLICIADDQVVSLPQ